MYDVTLENQAADKPDFMLSLGDIFGDDHFPTTITSSEVDALHKDYRPFLGKICHSIPFYVCLGNHEGENDYYYSLNQPNNLCIWGTQWRKFYYPNPFPNSFYTGNTENEPFGIGNPENYYAWTWGDALFVVLDVYRKESFKTLTAKPSNWNWTLGQQQYNWLKTTLESSNAKYKFVFAHHINGQGRGGITNAAQFEWGGLDNGQDKFATNRPGWAKPIHQLFKDNGVSIFFQGHDHVFAHETLDGIHYQEVPMPSDSTYMIGKLANADAYVSDTIDGTGHIRVTVSSECVKVDYVKAFLPKDTMGGAHHNREIAFSYSLGTCTSNGTAPINPINHITVFPNPAKEYLVVQFSNITEIKQIELINTLGQTIHTSQSNLLQVKNIPSGIYILQIHTNQGLFIEKTMIQH